MEKRVAALDLLRGLAATAVMIPHYFILRGNDPGRIAEVVSISAVEVFFVLSGYVLGSQIVLCGERKDFGTLVTFLVRRWMRTVPPYIIALVAMSLVMKPVAWVDFLRYATYTQNFFFLANQVDYFSIAWSLSVEEWYSVTFPIIVISFSVLARSETRFFFAAVSFIVAVTLARLILGDHSEHWGEAVRRIVVFRIDSIAYGFLLFLAVRSKIIAHGHLLLRGAAFSATAAVLILTNIWMIDGAPFLRAIQPLLSAAFGLSAVALFASLDTLATAPKIRSAMLFAGRVSYPIYLFHLVILIACQKYGLALNLSAYCLAVVLLSAAFNFGFEQPLLAMRPSYRSRAKTAQSDTTVLAK